MCAANLLNTHGMPALTSFEPTYELFVDSTFDRNQANAHAGVMSLAGFLYYGKDSGVYVKTRSSRFIGVNSECQATTHGLA